MAVVLTMALPLSSCKLIKTSDLQKKEEQAGPGGDAQRVSTFISNTYDAKLIPLLKRKAVDLSKLQQAIKDNLDKAGKEYGVRGGGAGGSWNFVVDGTAKVLEVDTKSAAGIAKLDIDGDGKVDALLQIGPVVRGTALRDVAPKIYDFSSFRDQIEFAKLGRGLNEKAIKAISGSRSGLEAKTISFLGVVAIQSAKDMPLILPVSVEVAP